MRRAIIFTAAMLMLAALTSSGSAAEASKDRPFTIGWAEVHSGNPIAVPEGTPLLFQPGWGFAAVHEMVTDPVEYLQAFLSDGYTFEMLLDGQPLAYSTVIRKTRDYCALTADGTETICQDLTSVHWRYLSAPLSNGDHTVSFRLTFLKDFPDEGWGNSVSEGDVFEGVNTLVVGNPETETFKTFIYVCSESDSTLYPSYWGFQSPVGSWPSLYPTISHEEAVSQFQGAGLSLEDAEIAARAMCSLGGSPPDGGGSDSNITLDQTPVWGELWIPPSPATYPPVQSTSAGP
jgi:hypothetical protein